MLFADLLPFLRAAVDWARYESFSQGLAVEDAAFARDAPYKEPRARAHMLDVFRGMARSVELPDRTRRFYGFLAGCLLVSLREDRAALRRQAS